MAEVIWIKLYTSFFDNKKVRVLRKWPDGDRMVLFYIFLLTRAGQCNDGGRVYFSETKAYNKFSLALEFGCTAQFVEETLHTLSLIEMVEYNDDDLRILDWEKHQNAEGLERIREANRERSRRYREKKRTEQAIPVGSVPALPAAAEEAAGGEDTDQPEVLIQTPSLPEGSAAVLELPLNDGTVFQVVQEEIDRWQETFPAVDVLQELREMRLWCDANPTKRKTARGIRKFIIHWLSKAQDDAGGMKSSSTVPLPERKFVPTEL